MSVENKVHRPGRPCPAPRSGLFFHPAWPWALTQGSPLVSLQATFRRLNLERKTLNLWPHSSVIAALPKPGETWVPSAEVSRTRHHHIQPFPCSVGTGGAQKGREDLLWMNGCPAQEAASTRWQHSPPQACWPVGFLFVPQKGCKTSLVSFLPGSLFSSQVREGDCSIIDVFW